MNPAANTRSRLARSLSCASKQLSWLPGPTLQVSATPTPADGYLLSSQYMQLRESRVFCWTGPQRPRGQTLSHTVLMARSGSRTVLANEAARWAQLPANKPENRWGTPHFAHRKPLREKGIQDANQEGFIRR